MSENLQSIDTTEPKVENPRRKLKWQAKAIFALFAAAPIAGAAYGHVHGKNLEHDRNRDAAAAAEGLAACRNFVVEQGGAEEGVILDFDAIPSEVLKACGIRLRRESTVYVSELPDGAEIAGEHVSVDLQLPNVATIDNEVANLNADAADYNNAIKIEQGFLYAGAGALVDSAVFIGIGMALEARDRYSAKQRVRPPVIVG